MIKFEVGKQYKEVEDNGSISVVIEVLKRTDKTITFKYVSSNWWEKDIDKTYRKTINKYDLTTERIDLDTSVNAPTIKAII